jgi:hypothetical protein
LDSLIRAVIDGQTVPVASTAAAMRQVAWQPGRHAMRAVCCVAGADLRGRIAGLGDTIGARWSCLDG